MKKILMKVAKKTFIIWILPFAFLLLFPPPVVGAYVTVTSPNGGEIWGAGCPNLISWASDVEGDVDIELYKGGFLDSTVAASTQNEGSYLWTPPISQTVGSDYRIKISSASDSSIFDLSNEDFTIPGHIAVTSPNDGESWARGTTNEITWSSIVT